MEINKSKRIALYIRVSSKEQKREGLSLDVQERAMTSYAKDRGWQIINIFRDEGISAKIPLEKRPQGKLLMQGARSQEFDAILIVKFDRAFRNTKDAITISEELSNLKIDLISLREQIDTTTAMGRFFFTINSAYAQLERELTGERVDEIRNDKFEQGLMIGKAPFGYKWSKTQKKFVVDQKRAKIVKQIFEQTAQGVRWKDILQRYKISKSTYYDILKNKTYIGIISYNGTEREGAHEPLISKEIFYAVNNKN